MKRLIVPVKATVTVASGIGSLLIGPFSGAITYLVVQGPSGAKGTLRLRDDDETQDIFRDPKPGFSIGTVRLDFYSNEVRIPINGPQTLFIEAATADGAYTVYYVFEERGNRV